MNGEFMKIILATLVLMGTLPAIASDTLILRNLKVIDLYGCGGQSSRLALSGSAVRLGVSVSQKLCKELKSLKVDEVLPRVQVTIERSESGGISDYRITEFEKNAFESNDITALIKD
jgi:hypothetical protein